MIKSGDYVSYTYRGFILGKPRTLLIRGYFEEVDFSLNSLNNCIRINDYTVLEGELLEANLKGIPFMLRRKEVLDGSVSLCVPEEQEEML
jgi:hypothetical protein